MDALSRSKREQAKSLHSGCLWNQRPEQSKHCPGQLRPILLGRAILEGGLVFGRLVVDQCLSDSSLSASPASWGLGERTDFGGGHFSQGPKAQSRSFWSPRERITVLVLFVS